MTKKKPIIGVASKYNRKEAIKLAAELLDWIKEQNLDFKIEENTATALELNGKNQDKVCHREKLCEECDIIVVLGGDGTLISVSRNTTENPPVIIGVNLGTLGFLTEITTEELYSTLEEAISGDITTESRALLEAKVTKAGEETSAFFAVNDVVITKEALARIFSIELYIDDDFAAEIRGDGVIIATPGGSTAYSMAAGGSIVHPQVDAVLITPIAPHSLTSRPLVIPGSSKIRLKVQNKSQEKTDTVFLTIDGQEGMALADNDEVMVETSKNKIIFAKSPSKSYYQVLGTKLKWANH